MNCRLCQSSECCFTESNGKRTFYYCPQCHLVFVPPEEYISFDQEKIRYSHHDNSASSKEYVGYLTDVSANIARIPVTNPEVIDFGSGYAFVLTRILMEKGLKCVPYDPLYDIGKENLLHTYDIVVVCETIEHLRDLSTEIKLIERLCKPEGYIFIHTRMYDKKEAVPKWWYASDETHINFFNMQSMHFLAELMDKRIFFSDNKNIVIFKK